MIFGIVGLYSFIHEKKSDITFEIVGESNLLDVRKPLSDLMISFEGQDIQKNNLNLRILTLRIENTGEVDILQNFYDNTKPWGCTIQDGKVVEIRTIGSNSDYLKNSLQPTVAQGNNIKFNKVIFERGKYVILEILVLHGKERLPELLPYGKIVGIDNITPKKSWLENEKPSFFSQLFYGGLLVQIVRPIIYLIGFIALIGILISITDIISSIKVKLRKKKNEKFKRLYTVADVEKYKVLLDLYIDNGLEEVKRLQRLLDSEENLIKEIENYKKRKIVIENRKKEIAATRDDASREMEMDRMRTFHFIYDILFSEVIPQLQDEKFITKTGDKIAIDAGLKCYFSKIMTKQKRREIPGQHGKKRDVT
jgi:hypothetical protein